MELDDDSIYVCETGPCNGSGWVAYGGGGDLVDDTSPQLGADLNVGGFAITDTDGDTYLKLETADDDTVRLGSASHEFFTGVYDSTDLTLEFLAPAGHTNFAPMILVRDTNGDDYFGCFIDTQSAESSTCVSYDPELTNWYDSLCYGVNCAAGVDGYAFGRDSFAAGQCVAAGRSSSCVTNGNAYGDGARVGASMQGFGDDLQCGTTSTGSRGVCMGTDIQALIGATDGFVAVFGTGFDMPNTYNSAGGIGMWDRNVADDVYVDRSYYLGGDDGDGYFERLVSGSGHHNATPRDFTFTFTAGKGTDIAAADVYIDLGAGTGAGAGGGFIIRNAASGGSSSTINSHTTAFMITGETGDVGIGAAAEERFHVETSSEGDVAHFDDGTEDCKLDPDSAAPTWTCTSDARLKRNIRISSLSMVENWLRVPIRSYQMIKSGESKIGPIAQELQSTHSELVVTREDGTLAVRSPNNYELLLLIQHQQNLITGLQERIATLEDAGE